MTIREILEQVDNDRPNTIDNETKIKWLSQFDKKLYNEVYSLYKNDISKPDNYTDDTCELLIEDEYSDIYVKYISSKIDIALAEYNRYAVDQTEFNSLYQDYLNYYNRTHKHHQTKPKYTPLVTGDKFGYPFD